MLNYLENSEISEFQSQIILQIFGAFSPPEINNFFNMEDQPFRNHLQ